MEQNQAMLQNPNCEHHYFESLGDALAMLDSQFGLCEYTAPHGKTGLQRPHYLMQSLRGERTEQVYYIVQNRTSVGQDYDPKDALPYIGGNYGRAIRILHTGLVGGMRWCVSIYQDTALAIAAERYREDYRAMPDHSLCEACANMVGDEFIPLTQEQAVMIFGEVVMPKAMVEGKLIPITREQAVSIFGEVVEPRPNHEN